LERIAPSIRPPPLSVHPLGWYNIISVNLKLLFLFCCRIIFPRCPGAKTSRHVQALQHCAWQQQRKQQQTAFSQQSSILTPTCHRTRRTAAHHKLRSRITSTLKPTAPARKRGSNTACQYGRTNASTRAGKNSDKDSGRGKQTHPTAHKRGQDPSPDKRPHPRAQLPSSSRTHPLPIPSHPHPPPDRLTPPRTDHRPGA
jgi:hypothetical protein